MTTTEHPTRVVRQFGSRGPSRSYSRFLIHYPSRLTAQVIVVAQQRLRMAVRANENALAMNFGSNQVTHPGLDGYLDRPGYYLHEQLTTLCDNGAAAILLNGNNVGYWGNQYVIENRKFKYKRRGPLFDDGKLATHATGDHAFFVAEGTNRYRITRLSLVGTQRPEGATLEDLRSRTPRLPRFGLSGFPLLESGRPVWADYGELAWDPGLLFDLGRIRDMDVIELRKMVHELVASKAPLARHPMTVIGLDDQDQVVLLVVERSRCSLGMTVDEAAQLLRRRFGVQDAIVLGAAGDAQLATTEEGFLIEPFIAEHAVPSARPIPDDLLAPHLKGRTILARPVPCYIAFELTDSGSQHERQPTLNRETAGTAAP